MEMQVGEWVTPHSSLPHWSHVSASDTGESGGLPCWNSSPDNVDVANGFISVYLGKDGDPDYSFLEKLGGQSHTVTFEHSKGNQDLYDRLSKQEEQP